ncbi:hypothetical protein B484DRAFT_406823 [Ochromonadaceae sp. CCMP2298]|nr:hypothetical protein B484DRAFT_406823 [Ochromonadaceae sp. CCMP2298]
MNLVITRAVLTRTQTKGATSGQEFNPAAFFMDVGTDKEYVIIACNVTGGGLCSTVMDADRFSVHKSAIYVHTNGYTYSRVDSILDTVHARIMGFQDEEHSIDHVNRIKTDNRCSNLRHTSQSVQNQNRADRSDRFAPPHQLLEIGITRMPRLMRWSTCDKEKKFVVDMPPNRGLLATTGTKSTEVSVINKFRDCLDKMMKREYFSTETLLAEEQHDALVKAAHDLDSDRFPDSPYSTDMPTCQEGTGMEYRQWCMDRLPPTTDDDVLHGGLNQEQTVVMLPAINACAIVKVGAPFKILLDAALFDRASSWGKIDFSRGIRIILNGENVKPLLKDVVWEIDKGTAPEAGFSIVPRNHQQFDLRSENLQMLLGEAKSFKKPADSSLFLPPGCSSASVGGRLLLPVGVTFSSGNLMFKETGKVIRVTAKPATIGAMLNKKVLPRMREREGEEEYDVSDAKYQRLAGEFRREATMPTE